MITRARVVLPDPDSPTSPTVSPAAISRFTPCRPRTTWPPMWKVLLASRTRTMVAGAASRSRTAVSGGGSSALGPIGRLSARSWK